jgi:arylsulfatase A-like enzyme
MHPMNITRRDFLKYSALAAAGGIAGLSAYGCSDDGSPSNFLQPASDHFPVIMVVVDTLRVDHLSTSGYTRDITPNLTAFCDQAYLFDHAISPSSWTTPSYISLMNGMYTFKNSRNYSPFDYNIPVLPELLWDIGYHPVRILTNGIVKNYTNGFKESYDYTDITDGAEMDRLAIEKAIEWLEFDGNSSNAEYFMLIWLMSPHWPYQPQNEYLKDFVTDDLYQNAPAFDMTFDCNAFGPIFPEDLDPEITALIGPPPAPFQCYQDYRLYVAAYDSNIRYADYQIGRLMEFLKVRGIYDPAMIIITSDHGENMIDHEYYFGHGEGLHHSLVNVPLMIKFPQQRVSSVISMETRTIDILPTVFDMLGIYPDEIDGKSLLPVISGEITDSIARPCVSSCTSEIENGEMFSLTYEGYKLIKTPGGDRLYDIFNDPQESDNVISLYPDIYAYLNDYLNQLLA